MKIKRALLVVVVASLLITAGCFGGIASENGDGETGDEEIGDEDVEADDETDEDESEELPDADELLAAAMAAESTVETVQGTQTVTVDDGEQSVTTTQKVWQRSSGQYRMSIVESDEPEQIDLMVTNGTTTWMYDEADDEAVRMELEFSRTEQEELTEDFTEALTADMNPTIEGTDTVADRDVYVLELAADGDDAIYESMTLWVDQETDYPVKQEATISMNGAMTTTVAFEDVTFDEEIPDDVFEFDPPEDAEVRDFGDLVFEQYDTVETADARVPFDLPDPDVPDEYALESVMIRENMAGWSASLQYEGDAETILTVTVAEEAQASAFERDSDPVEIDGVDATIREVTEDRAAVEWEDDGLSYVVNGELQTDELIAVAESIVE